MLLGDTRVPDAAFHESVAASTELLLAGTDPLYTHLQEQTAEAAAQAKNDRLMSAAGLIPVAYFGIRAAIEAAEHPDIAPALPASVQHRAFAVRSCSGLIIKNAVVDGTLTDYYENTPDLAPLLRARKGLLANLLADTSREALLYGLPRLGDVAIMDEGIVAGGALRLLRRYHRDLLAQEPAADIVGRSVGLQLVARVPDDALDTMRIHLGVPYTDPKHLQLMHGNVDFTSEARRFLHGLMIPGKGCPAHNVLTNEAASEPTYLRMAWADLARVLLPPHAKADLPAARPAGRKFRKK